MRRMDEVAFDLGTGESWHTSRDGTTRYSRERQPESSRNEWTLALVRSLRELHLGLAMAPPSEETVRIWLEVIPICPLPILALAVRRVLREHVWETPPKPAELAQAIEAELRDRPRAPTVQPTPPQTRRIAPAEYADCQRALNGSTVGPAMRAKLQALLDTMAGMRDRP